jgi:hypothetical protein
MVTLTLFSREMRISGCMTYRAIFGWQAGVREALKAYAARNCVRSKAASILFCSSSISERIV